MKAFFRHIFIQFKIDLREKGTLMTYYLVPLIFYFVMGSVFSSINPTSKATLSGTMAIFSVTMGAVLGMPIPIVKMREAGILGAYKVSGVPVWAAFLVQSISAFLHLLVVSIIIFITAPVCFKADCPKNSFAYFACLLILLFVNIALGLLIGVISKSQAASTMLSQAIFLPTVMLSGIMFPSSLLPSFLRIISKVLPATYIMQAFSGYAFNKSTSINPGLSLVVAVAMGVIGIFITVIRVKSIEKSF